MLARYAFDYPKLAQVKLCDFVVIKWESFACAVSRGVCAVNLKVTIKIKEQCLDRAPLAQVVTTRSDNKFHVRAHMTMLIAAAHATSPFQEMLKDGTRLEVLRAALHCAVQHYTAHVENSGFEASNPCDKEDTYRYDCAFSRLPMIACVPLYCKYLPETDSDS
jgi:hypothetical protein